MKTVAFLAAALAGLASLPADAQVIYKFVRPDGRVVYSDKKVAGARLEEQLERAPKLDPASLAAAREAARVRARALREAAAERTQAISAIDAEIRAAARDLAAAQQQLEAGREPRPGERLGTVSGRSRLDNLYWARQLDNEQAVAEAEERLGDAHAARNALR